MELSRLRISNGMKILLLFSFSSIVIYAYSSGITGHTLKSGTGCTCHSPNPSSDVSVIISGPDTLSPGETGNYTVTITGGPLVRAGTDIAASAGTLAPSSSDLRLNSFDGELTHTSPKVPVSQKVTFQFKYTAPASTGRAVIYATGNSVNFNGAPDAGDHWNFAANKNIVINSITGIMSSSSPNTFRLEQNYPNPFNPSTVIKYNLPASGFVTLKVYDVRGNEVAALVNEYQEAGSYSKVFSMRQIFNYGVLTSGVYFYRLTIGRFSSVKKMILAK